MNLRNTKKRKLRELASLEQTRDVTTVKSSTSGTFPILRYQKKRPPRPLTQYPKEDGGNPKKKSKKDAFGSESSPSNRATTKEADKGQHCSECSQKEDLIKVFQPERSGKEWPR